MQADPRTTLSRQINNAAALAVFCTLLIQLPIPLVGVAAPAAAQNALGDGRGLENRHVTAGRGNYQRPDLSQELNFRNSIVTGNAPNFLSFRGNVPYSDPDSFRGELGSNDLFAFRRDSLFSGLAGQGIRGTEALQFQASLTTGTSPPPGLVGPFVVNRAGSGRSARNVLEPRRLGGDPRDTALTGNRPGIGGDGFSADLGGTIRRSDPISSFETGEGGLWQGGGLRGLLRSPTSYTTTRDYRPAYLGIIPDEQRQPRALTATGLLGIRLSPIGGEDAVAEQRDRADAAADGEDGLERAPGAPQRIGAQRIDSRVRTAHDQLLERFSQRPLQGGDTDAPAIDLQPGQQPGEQPGEEVPGDQNIAPWQRDLLDLRNYINRPDLMPEAPDRTGEQDDQSDQESGDGDGDGQPERGGFDRLLDDDVVIERLAASPDSVDDTFARLVRRAEGQIREGRYFDAEETFSVALSIKPNDPGAQIGRIHAQLGAGLFLSAAVNVRQVFTLFPEFAAARFGRRLLPPRDRIDGIIETLDGYLETDPGSPDADGDRAARLSGSLRAEAGLLLAYIGRQTSDPELVRRGLADYRRAAEGDPTTDDDDATPRLRLLRVLEPAWLERDGRGERNGGEADDAPSGPSGPSEEGPGSS